MIDLEQAKELINDYCLKEFGYEADFSDLENVGLAYTTMTEYEIPVQVSVDLVHMKIKTWIGADVTDKIKPDKEENCSEEDLQHLDFDDLISGWYFYIEENIEKYAPLRE